MTGNLSGFNASEVEPNSFDCLPDGEYEVAIVCSGVEVTKAGTGKYLQLELQVLAGKYSGRKLFDILNLWNPSPKAVEIAKGTLSAICRAVGVLTPQDATELHDKPLLVAVGTDKSEQYGDRNKIKAYKPRGAAKPVAFGGMKAEVAQQLAQPVQLGVPDDEIPF
jgi:hypothetical protein